jgi:glycosyltransferase involved in cell wall biosynthesis
MTESDRSSQPRVSVIIPTYNRADDLKRCLESLVTQTFRNFEVLVCDDGSIDHTQKVVESFSHQIAITYYWGKNFGGPARPRNTGLKHAKGQYVAFLDSDDWWLPEKLQASVEKLDAGADLVYHDLYLISSLPAKPRFWNRAKTRQVSVPVFNDMLYNGNAINNSSVVVKRELMNKIGGFSEDILLIAAEDYDAWLRIAKHTEAFERLEKPHGFYWAGGGNISAPKRSIINLTRLFELYAAELSEDDAGPLPGWMAYSLARAYFLDGKFECARGYAKISMQRGNSPLIFTKSVTTFLLSMARLTDFPK